MKLNLIASKLFSSACSASAMILKPDRAIKGDSFESTGMSERKFKIWSDLEGTGRTLNSSVNAPYTTTSAVSNQSKLLLGTLILSTILFQKLECRIFFVKKKHILRGRLWSGVR